MASNWELPTFQRKTGGERRQALSLSDPSASDNDAEFERDPLLAAPVDPGAPGDESKLRPRGRRATAAALSWRRTGLLVVAAFVLGYYAQVLVFFFHVRLGFTGAILPTREASLAAKFTQSLIERTRHIIFVCRKTNWDFVGLITTPHAVIFAHDDVQIPKPVEDTVAVVRHSGVDSYLNLHNKTLTIMSHVHHSGADMHFFKQDDEAVIYWPHYYQCMQQCKKLGSCYAGDMHVNIGDAANANSYVFATGGSYFIGNELLKCLLDKPVFVRLDGLDFGEDKTVGKMIHYNKCDVQYVSCKWFNNKEVYSPNVVVRMAKYASQRYIVEDSVLMSQAEQEAVAAVQTATGDVAT